MLARRRVALVAVAVLFTPFAVSPFAGTAAATPPCIAPPSLLDSCRRAVAAVSEVLSVPPVRVVVASVDGAAETRADGTVVLDAVALARLTDAGLQVVLRHEFVHVATLEFSSGPQWLVEGFAEQVAWRDSDLPARAIAQELAAQVQADGVPEQLPDDAAFARDPAAAYAQAWLAVDLLIRRLGDEAFLACYRAGGVTTDLGMSRAELTRDWRAEVLRTLG